MSDSSEATAAQKFIESSTFVAALERARQIAAKLAAGASDDGAGTKSASGDVPGICRSGEQMSCFQSESDSKFQMTTDRSGYPERMLPHTGNAPPISNAKFLIGGLVPQRGQDERAGGGAWPDDPGMARRRRSRSRSPFGRQEDDMPFRSSQHRNSPMRGRSDGSEDDETGFRRRKLKPFPRPNSNDSPMLTEDIMIPGKKVGLIIGLRGEMIKQLQEKSGAQMTVRQCLGPWAKEKLSLRQNSKPLRIRGDAGQVEHAKKLVYDLIGEELEQERQEEDSPFRPSPAKGQGDSAEDDDANYSQRPKSFPRVGQDNSNCITEHIIIPGSRVGLVIGRGGEMIKQLQEKSGTEMLIVQHRPNWHKESQTQNRSSKPLRITGEPGKVEHAKMLVYELIGDELEMTVPRAAVGVVIGKGGDMIKKIYEETGARIEFQVPLQEEESDERKCMVIGRRDDIEVARQRIVELIDGVLGRNSDMDRGGDHRGGMYDSERGRGGSGHFGGSEDSPGSKCGLTFGRGGEAIKQNNQQPPLPPRRFHQDRRMSPEIDERVFASRGSDERMFGGRGSDERSFAARGSDERTFATRGSDERMFPARCSDERAYGAHGSDERGFGARGSQDPFEPSKQLSMENLAMQGRGANEGQLKSRRENGRLVQGREMNEAPPQQQQDQFPMGGGGSHSMGGAPSQDWNSPGGYQRPQQPWQNPQAAHPNDLINSQVAVNPKTGQPDYRVQWLEYFRAQGKHREAELVEQQITADQLMPAQQACQPQQQASQQQPPGGAQNGITDYSAYWVVYYRSRGMIKEAEFVEEQIKAKNLGGSSVRSGQDGQPTRGNYSSVSSSESQPAGGISHSSGGSEVSAGPIGYGANPVQTYLSQRPQQQPQSAPYEGNLYTQYQQCQ